MDQEQNLETRVPDASAVSRRAGLLTGLIAGTFMTMMLVSLRFALDTPVVHELLADSLTRITPPFVFDFILENLQVAAKPLLSTSLLVGQVLVGGGLGVVYARYS